MNLDKNLIRLLKKEKRPFMFSSLYGAFAVLMLVGQAWALSGIIEQLFRNATTEWRTIFPKTSLFILFSLLRLTLNWAGHHAARSGAIGIRNSLSERLTRTVAGLGPAFSRSEQSGRIVNTMLKGVEALDAWYSQYIPQLFLAAVTPVVILVAVFPSDWIAGAIMLGTAPLIPVFMILIGRSASAATERQWTTMSRMSGYFLDMLQGLSTLKLFAQEKVRRDGIEDASENFRRSTMQVLKIAFLSSLTLELVGTIGTAIVAVSIGLRLVAGAIPFRPAMFTLLLIPDFYLTLRQLGTRFHAGMEGVSASREIHEILDREPDLTKSGTRDLSAGEVATTGLTASKITYAFPGSARPAIDVVTLTIRPGTKTAITGPSGSGKSTLLNLLLRFIEPESGTITLGSTPVSDYSLASWYRQISWVPQHPFLFNASIRENLLMAKPGASDTEIENALSQAGLLDMVLSLPARLDTVIGEQGARLSGGEAQRLALARAFLKNAPILLMDEPTSHTDPILESLLRKAMEKLLEGRTTIMIAHRLESIRNADTIVVLDQGHIVQQGTHEELSRAEGFYRRAILASSEEAA
ncbi:MAG: thiol reductant ABC exporter subunit CydD [Chlorobiaceae bacterium]|nr:thiol reductant ABC exporter subunit CydD [Chlorobiaceae bacterium]